MKFKPVITVVDVLELGACIEGVLEFVEKQADYQIVCDTDDFPDEDWVQRAANSYGNNYSFGYGSGSGNGYSFGYGSGSGSGNGYGSGSGNGYGDCYGDGNCYGDGYGDGYGGGCDDGYGGGCDDGYGKELEA